MEQLAIANAGAVTFAVPARHAESMRRLGPWYLVAVEGVERVATITSRNGSSRLLLASDALAFLEGRAFGPEPRTVPVPAGVQVAAGWCH